MINGLRLSLLLLGVFCSIQNISAQYHINGCVKDSINEPLASATVMLINNLDSSLEAFAITEQNGNFELKSRNAGEFRLQITFIGYGDFEKLITIDDNQKELKLGEIVLKVDVSILEGVVVESGFVPVVYKGDTIEYNPRAFNIEANSNVGELLKAMPGIDIEEDGTIKVQGKKVNQILVEGEEFFDDKTEMATNNISANIVDKVQVYDKRSDFALFSGLDDGKRESIIDLKIKKGMFKGTFGDVEAAYGLPDNRFKGALNLNRFNKKMQVSVIGSTNNIDKPVIKIEDYQSFSGATSDAYFSNTESQDLPLNLFDNSGITESQLLGTNLNYKFSKKSKLHFDYSFSNSDNLTESESSSKYFIESDFYLEDEMSKQNSSTKNHRTKLELKQDIKDNQKFTIRGLLLYNDVVNNDSSRVKFDWDSSQFEKETNSITNNDFQNAKLNLSSSYYFKFKKRGRALKLKLDLNNFSNSGVNHLSSSIEQKQEQQYKEEKIDQEQETESDYLNYSVNLLYTEPLNNSKYLQFSAMNYNTTNEIDKEFYDSSVDSRQFIDSLSNSFDSRQNITSGKMSIHRVKRKSNFSMGLTFQNNQLKSNSIATEGDKYNYNYLLPTLNYIYKFTRYNIFDIKYNTNINTPRVSQLQEIVDNSNPSYIYIGNPALKPEYSHNFAITYSNSSIKKWFHAGLYAKILTDEIVNSSSVNSELQTIYKPINSKSAYSGYAEYYLQYPIFKSSFKIVNDGDFSYDNNNIFVNEVTDKLNTFSIYEKIELRNRKTKKYNYGIGANIDYYKNSYKISSEFDNNYFNYGFFADFLVKYKNSLTISSDFKYKIYSKTEYNPSQSYRYLNMTISKTFYKKQLNIYTTASNLFDEDAYVIQSNSSNRYYEQTSNRMGRYILVGLKYTIGRFDN